MGLDVTFYKATDPDMVWDPETRKHVKVPNFKGYEITSIKKPRLFMDWLARLHGLEELEDYATYPVKVAQAYELIELINGTDPNDIRKTFPAGAWSNDGSKKWELEYHGTYMWELESLKTSLLMVLDNIRYYDEQMFWVYVDW